jgi:hypothetical protein
MMGASIPRGRGGGGEVGAFVEVGEKEGGFDFGEGDFRGGGAEDSGLEDAGGIAAVDDDGLGIGFGEEENAEAGEGEVGFGFFVKVGAARGFAEDFKDDDRFFLVVEERVGGLADDHGVGVVEADVVAEGDADFGVAVAGVAGFAAELGSDRQRKIHANAVMPVVRSSHSMDLAAEVFVFGFSEFLGFEIFLFGEKVGLKQGCHGWVT